MYTLGILKFRFYNFYHSSFTLRTLFLNLIITKVLDFGFGHGFSLYKFKILGYNFCEGRKPSFALFVTFIIYLARFSMNLL
jgi:hypothetical protein